MIELRMRTKTVDLPFSIRIHDVTEEMFDEMVDEDTKADLLDGEMIVHSPASPRHDDLSGFLRMLMRGYAGKRRLGKVLGPDSLIRLARGRKFGPDIFFFEKHRIPVPLPPKEFKGVPDQILEILSPSNRDYDLEEKRPAYRKAGVKEIWFVDPDEEQVIVDRLSKNTYTSSTQSKGKLTSVALAGFWIDVAWLWGDELPDEMECLAKILK